MRKIYLSLFFGLILLGSVYGETITTINSIDYKDRNGNTIIEPINTGDQIFVDASVFASNSYSDIKSAMLTWDSSWVDCYYREVPDNTHLNYKCILTVTPFMTTTTQVNLKVESSEDGVFNTLIGTYNFNGQLPPVPNGCTYETQCSKYAYSYEKQCTRYRTDMCKQYAYRTEKQCIKTKNGVCTNYKKVKIKEGCLKYYPDDCQSYKMTRIQGECLKLGQRMVCN